MPGRPTRRQLLAGAGSAGVAGLAGCLDTLRTLLGNSAARADAEAGTDPYRVRSLDEVSPDTTLPLRDRDVPMAHDHREFEGAAEWGGTSKNGIPSIDDPAFAGPETGDGLLAPGDPVFGVRVDGDPRAYPQHILVRHEVVNDTFGDRGVAVTYCPLTGTAVGFERGTVEFGVSGMLVNNNLVMYDRETDSWWPQMLGTSVLGERNGLSLREVRVTWTTWERWRRVHPDTAVLTEDTGEAFGYDNDPYGNYNPRSGYYADSDIQFPVMHEDDRHHPKTVVVGARGEDGPVAFLKNRLREERLLETSVGGVAHIGVYHEALDSAWVYRNPGNRSVRTDGTGYAVDGTRYAANDLPLPSILAFDAMWFAWAGFYPDTALVD